MKCHIIQVKPDGTQVLVTQHALLGSPLESSDARILDLVKILDSLCAVDHDVGSAGLRAEAPDLSGLSDVELVLVGEVTATDLEVVPGVDLTLVNVLSQTIGHGNGPHEKPVVLVWRLGQTHLARLLGDSLSVGHDGVGLLQRDLGVVLLKILEADLEMELTSSGNDVLSRLLNDTLDHGVRLGEPLQTLDQLGQISRVL